MIKPSIDELLTKVENRYVLVNLTARRARMLNEGSQSLTIESDKHVATALNEINEGKVKYERKRF
ncbi:MAG TPA: DNA-directed RNA polymerase subunit omega [Thermoclostridium sp.]|nr:DNA-directed RNA polymerase subunit omega [Thermoclostridium sp.]